MGNCLDLSLLWASMLEQAGLAPWVVLLDDHAVAGVWLDPPAASVSVVQDPRVLMARVERGEMLLVDPTAAASRPAVPFDAAERMARTRIERMTDQAFQALDIVGCRVQGIRPWSLADDSPTAQAAPAAGIPARAAGTGTDRTLDVRARSEAGGATSDGGADPRVQAWSARLLDLSLRNRLLNFTPGKRDLSLVCPDPPSRVETLLRTRDRVDLRPRAGAGLTSRPDELEAALREAAGHEAGAGRLLSRHEDATLQTLAVQMFRQARTALEEGGASSVFLTLGMLEWFESPASSQPRRAPVLLLPVEWEREGGGTPRLRRADEEASLNHSLIEKLRQEFAIDLGALAQALPLHPDGGLDVEVIFQRVRDAVKTQPRWRVLEEAHIGLFTFQKLLMWRDLVARTDTLMESPVVRAVLEGRALPASAFAGGGGTRGPLPEPGAPTLCPMDADGSQLEAVEAAARGESFVLQGPPGTGKSQTITNIIADALARGRRVLFVSEKMAALEVVHRRLTQVGLGPFCLEVHSNQARRTEFYRQLFHAVEASRERTVSDWEARSRELARVRDLLDSYARALREPRAHGHSVFAIMGRAVALRAQPGLDVSHPTPLRQWDAPRWTAALEALAEFEGAARAVGVPVHHPLEPVVSLQWSPTLHEQVERAVEQVHQSIDAVAAAWRDAAGPLGESEDPPSLETLHAASALAAVLQHDVQPPAAWVVDGDWTTRRQRLVALVDAGRRWQETWAPLADHWSRALVKADTHGLRRSLQVPWWMWLLVVPLLVFLQARRTLQALLASPLPLTTARALEALDQADRARDAERLVLREAEGMQETLGLHWRGLDTDWAQVVALVERADAFRTWRSAGDRGNDPAAATQRARALGSLLGDEATRLHARAALDRFAGAMAALQTAWQRLQALLPHEPARLVGGLRTPGALATLRRQSQALCRSPLELRQWGELRRTEAPVRQAGLARIVDGWWQGGIDPSRIVQAGEASLCRAWLSDIFAHDPVLQAFDRGRHERTIADFRRLDRALLAVASREIVARLCAGMAHHQQSVGASSQLGVLMRELQKGRNQMPIRRLFREIPELLTELKPCVMASPLSVAQYLDPALPSFDLVIFDEASQIPASDALGSLARGRQVIVVGDTRQLPPTTFFDRVSDADPWEEGTVQELESVLHECLASGMPERMLRWHYRSNHESLIAFSNLHYYDGRLITFPSATFDTTHSGVSWVPVPDGRYERGGSRTNRAEAEAVVQWLQHHVQDMRRGSRTVGVVTLNLPQAELIENLVDQARRSDPALDAACSHVDEPLFIKNLENVQGDERDIILFSPAYGPDEFGRIPTNFGALNREGGERRLNVAITRAREQMVVISTLTWDRIDTRRTAARGVHHLHSFLRYAAEGPGTLGLDHEVLSRFDSPFEKEVHDRLAGRGWVLDSQVGVSGYRIDLGVRHPDAPGRYLMGIECDGRAYHSSALARERDRLRQQVLEEKMGWSILRVWSTDWWVAPDSETDRLDQALRAALERAVVTTEPEKQGQAAAAAPSRIESATTEVLPDADTMRRMAGAWLEQARTVDPDRLPGALPWTEARLPAPPATAQTLRQLTPRQLEVRLRVVLDAEAPLHLDELSGRIQEGMPGRAQRVSELVEPLLTRWHRQGEFVWKDAGQAATWQGFRPRGPGGEARNLTLVAPEELHAAMEALCTATGGLDREEFLRLSARVFGIQRLAARQREVLEDALNAAGEDGRLVQRDGRVALGA
jgi:very-short-patch-repair endonuclease